MATLWLAPLDQTVTVIRTPGGIRFKVLFSNIEVGRILLEAPTEGARSAMSLEGEVPTQAQLIRALVGHESNEEGNKQKAEKMAVSLVQGIHAASASR